MSMLFKNYGGIFQFAVRDEGDLARIEELDLARWAATSAPLRDLQVDPALRRYLDPDGTGRMRASQLVDARDWAFARLAKRQVIGKKTEVIPLDALASDGDGAKIRAAAERVNAAQSAADRKAVALADIRAFKAGYHKLLANGDGIIPPDVVDDAAVKAAIADIAKVAGAKRDRGGSDGVDQALLDAFTAGAKDWLAWKGRAAEAAVWGDDTAAAEELVKTFDPRVERYFLQAELLRQEAATAAGVRLKDDDLRALRAKDSAAIHAHLAEAPLAAPDPSGVLPLGGEINALYAAGFADLVAKVIRRAEPGATSITWERWRALRATFDPYRAWLAAKPAAPYDDLGEARVRELVEGDLPARILALIEQDRAAQAEIDSVDDLEKLALLARHLIDITNNFVNLSGIYDPTATNLVDTGSLVIDARRLEFCMRVPDRGAHKAVATESRCFLVYATVSEKEGGGETFEVVAPVTGGEKGRLRVGKRGLFVDKAGREWDAQVVELVDNPISVREAAFAPFRRAADFVSTKIEEWVGAKAAAQQEALAATTASSVESARTAAEAPPTPPPPPGAAPATAVPTTRQSEGLNINSLIVGGGVALAGLGAVLASLFGALTSLKGWAAILGLVGAVLAVSALSGWFKLRKRDMSLILEASGWAMNVHMKVTARVAPLFAFTPDLPKSAVIDRRDVLPPVPGEGRVQRLLTILLLTILAAVVFYALQHRGVIKL